MEISELKKGSHIHMMGICGTAMGSLAGILQQMGFRVTGSDQNVYPPMSTQLRSLGIEIREGYKKENLNPRPDFVIVGNVMTRKHEEVIALLETDIPYTSLPKAMGEMVIANRNSVVISGTHGKTTTTSMMTWVAECCEKQPGYLIGGVPLNFQHSFRSPKNNWFVIEGDEYDTAFFDKVPKFIHYKPKYVILTSIEFDHADIYKDLDDVKNAFRMLMKLIPEDGILLYQAKDENIKSILHETKCKNVVSYSVDRGDFTANGIRYDSNFAYFDVVEKGRVIDSVKIKVFGAYNIENALATYALSYKLGWDKDKIKLALMNFKGVKRRQEIIGQPNGITIIEDFAHHPTAVKVTLEGVRDRFAGANIHAVFEPRSATSRRKVFQKPYVEAFEKANSIWIMQPYNQTNIKEDDRFSSAELVGDLSSIGKDAYVKENVDQIVASLKSKAKSGDVVLIMSNGGFDGIYTKMLTELA